MTPEQAKKVLAVLEDTMWVCEEPYPPHCTTCNIYKIYHEPCAYDEAIEIVKKEINK